MDGHTPIDDLKATATPGGRDSHLADDAQSASIGPGVPAGADAPIAADYDALGIAAGESFLLICQIAGGEKWKPEAHERSAICAAWANYFRARGIPELPPEAFLVMAIAPYAMKRIETPKIFSGLMGVPIASDTNGANGYRESE